MVKVLDVVNTFLYMNAELYSRILGDTVSILTKQTLHNYTGHDR